MTASSHCKKSSFFGGDEMFPKATCTHCSLSSPVAHCKERNSVLFVTTLLTIVLNYSRRERPLKPAFSGHQISCSVYVLQKFFLCACSATFVLNPLVQEAFINYLVHVQYPAQWVPNLILALDDI